MNIDDEIEYLHVRIEDLISDQRIANWKEDWDRVDFISLEIVSLENELEALYELRSQLP